MLDAVAARQSRRIDLVRRGRNADAMGAFDRALLQQIRQPDVGLEHVVAKPARPFDLEVDDRLRPARSTPSGSTGASRRADTRSVKTRGPTRRPDSIASLLLERVVRHGPHVPEPRHAVGQVHAAEQIAVLLQRVAVPFDEARHHALADASTTACRRDASVVRLDGDNPVAVR